MKYIASQCGPAWCVRDESGKIVPNTIRDSRYRAMNEADLLNGCLVPGQRDWLIALEHGLAGAEGKITA
jgi:hypothetical protein